MADVVVVGAGAAGIFAAWRAASLGAKVLLLEKTQRLGTKILISGGGKCNITHDGPIEEVVRAFRPKEARFLRPSFYRFGNQDVVELLTARGLEVYTRENGRVFPVRQTAKDVVAILAGILKESGVDLRLDTPVVGLRLASGQVAGVETPAGPLDCPRVVLAVGGSSYPTTGTTGDGYAWAKAAGHMIVAIRAALAPMAREIEESDPRAGVALRGVVLKARREGKEVARWRDDLLFTHRGVSGPTVLGMSRSVAEQMECGQVILEVDLAPNETFEAMSARLKGWIAANPRRLVAGFLEGLVPKALWDDLLDAAGIDRATAANRLAQKGRNRLVEALKGWQLGPVREVVLEKGEVVAGGVALDEVDPQTMRSLRCPGLFLCGEILDVAGPVGGYNLQAAFSSGYVAGESAALDAGYRT